MRSPNATLPRTSRCGNSAWSWNMSPKPRRCGGTRGEVGAVPRDRARSRRARARRPPRRSVLLPLPLGPEDADDLAVGRPRGRRRRHGGELAVGHGEPARRRSIRTRRPIRRGSARSPRIGQPRSAPSGSCSPPSPRRSSAARAGRAGGRSATGSVGVSGRTMNTVAPNSPSEIANANPAATSAARADDRQVDLAPHPRRRRAEQSRPPRAAAGRSTGAPGA